MVSNNTNTQRGMHKNHRSRLKNRFLREGLSGFEAHNVLELLLFFSIPQKDTNETAHALLEAFGSLSGVFEAPFEELIKTPGISEHSATLIKLLPELWQMYELDRSRRSDYKIHSTLAAVNHVSPHFIGATVEKVVLICLDASGGLLSTELISVGAPSGTVIDCRKIIACVIHTNAAKVVLAHNHIGSSNLRPSAEDIRATRELAKMLKAIQVALKDHIIINEGKYFSMLENSAYAPLLDGGSVCIG